MLMYSFGCAANAWHMLIMVHIRIILFRPLTHEMNSWKVLAFITFMNYILGQNIVYWDEIKEKTVRLLHCFTPQIRQKNEVILRTYCPYCMYYKTEKSTCHRYFDTCFMHTIGGVSNKLTDMITIYVVHR